MIYRHGNPICLWLEFPAAGLAATSPLIHISAMRSANDYHEKLDQAETWIFDLDNTLYPATCNLFDQVDKKMGAFISDYLGVDLDEARR